ncbi:MAG: ferritin family protein [Polyangiaceae bacterium]
MAGPIPKLDFKALSLMDALDFAILIEEEARDRYEELADQLEIHRTPDAAKFFRFMSRNEEKHRGHLAGRRAELFGEQASRARREMLFDVEAPEYDEARAFMSVREALHASLRSEEKAHQFFVSALEHVTDAEVKVLFEELRGEELEHVRLLNVELEKLPPDPIARVEDFEDDPAPQ